MIKAYLNQIVTAVPDHDMHSKFVDYAPTLLSNDHSRALFKRMAKRSQIDHRYSFLKPHPDKKHVDHEYFYRAGNFPNTETRMRFYERHAFQLAHRALDQLSFSKIKDEITHLIITTCTGFYAPGLDFQIVQHYDMQSSVERTIIGFMGCYAGINALKMARHIVRSDSASKVAILNLELCTLHLKETDDLEQILSFLIFADGCAASIVSAEPIGIELQNFHATVLPNSNEQITWHIGELGFDMILSGKVPGTIATTLPSRLDTILKGERTENIQHWAIHPGGRTILDAIRDGIHLPESMLQPSRDILRRFGNMSSATIMFVLKEMMKPGAMSGPGCAMAFGPGLTVESMLFQIS